MVFLAAIDVHLPDAGFIARGLAEVAELAHGGDGYDIPVSLKIDECGVNNAMFTTQFPGNGCSLYHL